MSGLMALAATQTPAAIPPPLTETKMASSCGTCSRNSTASVPWWTEIYGKNSANGGNIYYTQFIVPYYVILYPL